MRKGKASVRNRSFVRDVFGWPFYLILMFVCVWLLISYVGERMEVIGLSMYPALNDGDYLLVDKISYHFTDPDRFDIVVFPFRYQENTFYMKRIIGLPGETVQIVDGIIYINGRELNETFGYGEIRNPGLASEQITLKQDEYFVLGDNRNNSSDSREPSVGNILRSDIIGKARFRIWPLRGFGFL